MKNLTASDMSLQTVLGCVKGTSFINIGSVSFPCSTTCYVIQH